MSESPLAPKAVPWDNAELLSRMLKLEDKQHSLASRIALEVALDIIEGRLPPGYDLNSIDLSQRFQTSRTPVREALLHLERGALVEIQSRRRPRVNVLTLQKANEIYGLRAELYALVSHKVALRIEEDDLAKLEGCLQEMREAVNEHSLDRYFWANVLFHEQVAAFAHDATLKRSLDGLGLQVLAFRHASLSVSGRMDSSLEDHTRMVRAYRERDADLAAALSRSVILSALRALEKASQLTNKS